MQNIASNEVITCNTFSLDELINRETLIRSACLETRGTGVKSSFGGAESSSCDRGRKSSCEAGSGDHVHLCVSPMSDHC